MSLPEEDLTCPVCCDIFSDPVLLSCSHSFCRNCLKRCWESRMWQCPVCRKKGLKSIPPSNLALKNVCEALLQVKRQTSQEEQVNCGQHGERLKLFCLTDEEPICVVCQASRQHRQHECLPVEEALPVCKDELNLSLKSLQDKIKTLQRMQITSADTLMFVKKQMLETQQRIRCQFKQLHEALHQEESERLEAVKREGEEKIAVINERIKELSADVVSVAETVSVIQRQLKEDDILLLKSFKATQDRQKATLIRSDGMSGLLIDAAKHLYNLKYRVWEKMLENVDYTPVTLDPNTAHPCLVLSDDLTSLHYSKQPSLCPDNPERFHMSAEVVGMTALGSGSHHWVVETGSNQDWLLGVSSLCVQRDSEVNARPEHGFWTLCFRDGELRAMASPPSTLTLSSTLQQIKVQLDYNKGRVSFYNPAEDSLIYEFEETFSEPVVPYFYTQSSHPLKVMPEKILFTVFRHSEMA